MDKYEHSFPKTSLSTNFIHLISILRFEDGAVLFECFQLLTGTCLDRNLMAPDDFKNLGLIFDDTQGKGNTQTGSSDYAKKKS